MKRIICFALTLILALGLAAGAFAATEDEQKEWLAAKTDAVRAVLDDNGYNYDYSSSKDRFVMDFSIDNEFESCKVWALVNYDSVEFDVDFPIEVPEDRFADVAALFMRINELHRIVAFYTEYDSGIMGCKVLVYTEELTPSYDCLDYACWAPIHYAEQYGGPIYRLISGEMTVDEAFAAVEEIYNS